MSAKTAKPKAKKDLVEESSVEVPKAKKAKKAKKDPKEESDEESPATPKKPKNPRQKYENTKQRTPTRCAGHPGQHMLKMSPA